MSPTLSYLLAFLLNYYVPIHRSIARSYVFETVYLVAPIFPSAIFTSRLFCPFSLALHMYTFTNCDFVTIVQLLNRCGYYLRCYLLLYHTITFDYIYIYKSYVSRSSISIYILTISMKIYIIFKIEGVTLILMFNREEVK